METFYVILGYVWRVVTNAIQLLVVLYIFYKLNERFELIVVALLGLIYTTIRSIGFGLLMAFVNRALDRFFGSAYDCDQAAAVSPGNGDDLASLVEDGELSGDCCSENRSDFIDGLLPLLINGSCRNQYHAATTSQ